jgi:hypothetical protein
MHLRLQVLLGSKHRMSICTHHCPSGESSILLACVSHPIDVSGLSEYGSLLRLTWISVFMLVLTVFVVFSKKVNKLPPQGSPILDASNAIKIALKEKSFEKAKPSVLREYQRLTLLLSQPAIRTPTWNKSKVVCWLAR